MISKKIGIVMIFFVLFVAVSAVSAADNSTDVELDSGSLNSSYKTTDLQPVKSSYSEMNEKSPTEITVDSFKTKIGSKHSISAVITDELGGVDDINGIAKFKINGKTYKVKVKGGWAVVKNIKLPLKVKTLKCSVKFLGNKKYSASLAKFNIKLTKSNVVMLKKNHSIKIGKYNVKLTSKQYKALVKAFKKDKSKSIKIKTGYNRKFYKSYYKKVNHYKTLKTVKTFYGWYLSEFKKMRSNGWKKVSEYVFTKKNPKNKEGIGLSAYTYSISKWVKPSYHLKYKTKYYPVKAKITFKKSSKLPKIKLYSHGKTLKYKYLAIT